MPDYTVGYDPGSVPTLAVLNGDGKLLDLIEEERVGVRIKDKKSSLWRLSPELLKGELGSLAERGTVRLIVENVTIYPGQSIASGLQLVGSKFVAIGLAVGLGLQYDLVATTWRRSVKLPSKRDDPGNAMLRQAAMKAFPEKAASFNRVKDHNRADAALLALYAINLRK